MLLESLKCMNNKELLDIINDLADKLESNTIISAQLLRTFDDLKEFIENNKLGKWNYELQGFDKYE